MPDYRATIRLYPAVFQADSYDEAEQMLEDYKDELAAVINKIEFRDFQLNVELEGGLE